MSEIVDRGRAFIHKMSTASKNGREPIFIVGCPRSGTTLLQLLIASHPRIAIPPESHLFRRYSRLFHRYGDLKSDRNFLRFVRDLLSDRYVRGWNLRVSESDFIGSVTERSVRSVISALFELYAVKEDKARWGDKTPQHALFLDEIRAVFPQAKFIHIIRDGRDVAVSSSRTYVGNPSVYGSAREWRKYILAFSRFKRSVGNEAYLEVLYERLVRDTNSEIERIYRFLNEEPVPVGEYLPRSTAKDYYVGTGVHMASLKGPISTAKIGRFKQYLTPRDIEIFEAVSADALCRYGYRLESNTVALPLPHEKVLFFIMDHVYRYLRKYLRPGEIRESRMRLNREIQIFLRAILR